MRELFTRLLIAEALVGAVALGWPDEAPKARPRKPLADVVEWREE